MALIQVTWRSILPIVKNIIDKGWLHSLHYKKKSLNFTSHFKRIMFLIINIQLSNLRRKNRLITTFYFLIYFIQILALTLCEKYSHSEFFWSVFSRIQTEYGEIRSIRTRKTPNTDTFHAVLSLNICNLIDGEDYSIDHIVLLFSILYSLIKNSNIRFPWRKEIVDWLKIACVFN